jgi:hypothetical protein
MNQTPAPIAPATRTLKTLAAVTRLLLWVVLAAWGLFALTWGTLHFFIVPRIGEWRPELERWASASVGVPVRVGEIRAEPRGDATGWLPTLMPSLALRDVQLFDPQGRPALQLPLVRASVSVVWTCPTRAATAALGPTGFSHKANSSSRAAPCAGSTTCAASHRSH